MPYYRGKMAFLPTQIGNYAQYLFLSPSAQKKSDLAENEMRSIKGFVSFS